MPPKLEPMSELPIECLLSYQYDPAGYNQAAFHNHYQRLVDYRDDLRKQYDRKSETRASLRGPDGKSLNTQRSKRLADASSANPPKGSRFSGLPDDDNGSSSSALTKPTILASLSKKQLDKLSDNERKAAVRKIKKEIEIMKAEMKEQKKKDNEARKEAEDAKEPNDHLKTVNENQDETNESDQDEGWQTAKSSLRR